jgi:DNA-binding MarR family transcriptional regulator
MTISEAPPRFIGLDDALLEPLAGTVDPDNFTPRLLHLLSNALVWRESRELRRTCGLGTNEWRILSALATEPGMSAKEVSDFLSVNKALVSKATATLVSERLVVLSDGPRGTRPMYLTRAGAKMHDFMRPISMRGQEIIVDGMSDDQIDRFNGLLREMLIALQTADSLEAERP